MQETLRIRFFSGNICQSIGNFYPLSCLFFHVFADHKDLCYCYPLFLEPLVHLRTAPDFTHFSPPMSFIHFFLVLKFSPINSFILEKFSDTLKDRRRVPFESQQVISTQAVNLCTLAS